MMRLLGGPPTSVVRRPATRSATTGSRLPAARSISPRTAAHSSSSVIPASAWARAARWPASQTDIAARINSTSSGSLTARALASSSPTSTQSTPAARATGSIPASIATRAAVEHLGQRSRCRADRIERADPEARVGHDLTARRHRSFGLVVADDEDGWPRRAENRDRWQRERARSRFDLGYMSGQPGHHPRMYDEERARTRGLGDRDRPLASRQHQNVTVSPPSTVRTCPVM